MMSKPILASALDTKRRLNLGCGTRFHPAWTNLDLHPVQPNIRRHDLTQPLPFPPDHFDAVYHAHVLEHLRRERVADFLRECRRVLRPGGVLRVVAPDLEQIVRLYLETLERACRGEAEAVRHYPWTVLELLDQLTREQPGGAMLPYLTGEATSLAWYRLGSDGQFLRRHLETPRPALQRSWWQRLTDWLLRNWRERLARRLLGAEYALLQVGRFRRSGEVHHWMYDCHSLRVLLTEAGFADVRQVGPTESGIADWPAFQLDALPDGAPAKPDSLYVEARKP